MNRARKDHLIWISAGHKKIHNDFWHKETIRQFEKKSSQYILEVEEPVPPAFFDWKDKGIDLHFDKYKEVAFANQLRAAWLQGIPIALSKGGRWYILYPKPQDETDRLKTRVLIEETDATTIKDMLQFPDDWEKFVETS